MSTAGVTVIGTGAVMGVPDTAQLRLAAEAAATGVQPAVERSTAAVAAMRSALVEHGVEAKYLRSSEVAVHPDHSRGSGPRGYVARFGLVATLHEVETVGAAAQAALAAGGDAARLDGLSFIHSAPAALRAAAREAAFADARARAEQLAGLAGQALGVVEEITENAGRGGGPPVPVDRLMAAEAEGLALDAGQQEISVSVTVRWAWA